MDKPQNSTVEVQDIFHQYGEPYRLKYPLPLTHLKVMSSIEKCRTSMLGGHLDQCQECGYEKNAYNSCRNRHCPKCQSLVSASWLEDRKAELLPVNYFHIVFTIPHQLNAVVLRNKKVMYTLLFKCVWQTIKTLAQDKKYYNGQAGAIAVLHTWGQKLMDHPHVHVIVPAGALRQEQDSWNGAGPKCFLPVAVMREYFKKLFLKYLDKAYFKGRLELMGAIEDLAHPPCFLSLKDTLHSKKWVVYAKKPFAGPEQVLAYLARYTHRIAISNSRIIGCEDGVVKFRWRDYADGNKNKVISLDAGEFIRRFMLHVLPWRFVKIRFFGFLGNRFKKKNIETIRTLLHSDGDDVIEPVKKKSKQELMLLCFDIDVRKCPVCGSLSMERKKEIFPVPWRGAG